MMTTTTETGEPHMTNREYILALDRAFDLRRPPKSVMAKLRRIGEQRKWGGEPDDILKRIAQESGLEAALSALMAGGGVDTETVKSITAKLRAIFGDPSEMGKASELARTLCTLFAAF
jgi:hypothetical protein